MSKTYTNKDLRRNFIYSLIFYKDKQGTLCLTETANDGDLSDYYSMGLFGSSIAKSKYLDKEDKKSLVNFCQSYLNQHKKVYPEYWGLSSKNKCVYCKKHYEIESLVKHQKECYIDNLPTPTPTERINRGR